MLNLCVENYEYMKTLDGGWMDGWMDGRMEGWKDGRMDGS